MNDTPIYPHTGPHQNPGNHLESLLCLTVHIQPNLEAFMCFSRALPMPVSSATLPYGRASFASCLDYHISLLVFLMLAFTVVKCYFFLKNLTCIPLFRASLRTRSWLTLVITGQSLFSSFPPSMLTYTVNLRSPEHAVLLRLHSIAQPLVSMIAFCWENSWLILEASIQTLLLLQSHSCLLHTEVGTITLFPLHCVHSSRPPISILLFTCLLVGLYSVISDLEQFEMRHGLLFIVTFWQLV